MSYNFKLGLGLSLTTAVMWGLLPLALKGVLDALDPITLTWYRFSVSAAIALIWYGHRSGKSLLAMLRPQYLPLTLTVLVGLLVNYVLYIFGLDYTTAGAAQITIQLAPLLLLVGSVWLFKEPFSPRQWGGVAAFSCGLILFFNQRMGGEFNEQYLLGIALVLGAALSWTGYGLAQKKLLTHFKPQDILLLIYLCGTLVFLPASDPGAVTSLTPLQLALLAFASLNTIIAYGAFAQSMAHWEASRTSAIITLAPLLTLLFVQPVSWWAPDFMETEPLNWLSWLGAALVVGGSIVAAIAKTGPADTAKSA